MKIANFTCHSNVGNIAVKMLTNINKCQNVNKLFVVTTINLCFFY